MTARHRVLVAALVTVLALAPLPASATSAVASPMAAPAAPVPTGWTSGYCVGDAGVTVVVDFQELGGGTVTRCAQVSAGASGVSVLQAAGFSVTGTTRWGLGFVCRLQGRPSADEVLGVGDGYREACQDTPPGSAFWSYWLADNGGRWAFSQVGAGAHSAKPGSFEGWSFSLNKTPSTNPAPRVAPSRPAAPPAGGGQAGTGQGQAGTGQSGTGQSGTGQSGTGQSGTGQSGTGRAQTSQDGAAGEPDGAVGADDQASQEDAGVDPDEAAETGDPTTDPTRTPTPSSAPAAAPPGGGIPLSTTIGIGLVVLLAAAGATVAVMRRRSPAPAGGSPSAAVQPSPAAPPPPSTPTSPSTPPSQAAEAAVPPDGPPASPDGSTEAPSSGSSGGE